MNILHMWNIFTWIFMDVYTTADVVVRINCRRTRRCVLFFLAISKKIKTLLVKSWCNALPIILLPGPSFYCSRIFNMPKRSVPWCLNRSECKKKKTQSLGSWCFRSSTARGEFILAAFSKHDSSSHNTTALNHITWNTLIIQTMQHHRHQLQTCHLRPLPHALHVGAGRVFLQPK